MGELDYRSKYLVSIFEKHVPKDATILEIGHGDGRNIRFLKEAGWENVEGIDKNEGTTIEEVPEKEYDVIYTMSCLFLIPPENNWVFEKIARMAKNMIITVEGETTVADRPDVFGRDYSKVFEPFGFKTIAKEFNVFNQYGVARILCKK